VKKISILPATMLGCIAILVDSVQADLPASITNGLQAYWTFDGNAEDQSGNGFNLSAPQGEVYGIGRNGNLAAVMADNRFYRLSQALTTNNDFTWSIWFRPNSPIGPNISLINQGLAPMTPPFVTPYLSLNDSTWNPAGGVSGVTASFSDTWVTASTPITWSEDFWYSIIWTSDSSGSRTLYVNGAVSSSSTGLAYGQLLDNFYIGGTPQLSTNSYFFEGLIDDVTIYNRGLSPTEVTELYNAQSVPEPTTYALLLLSGAASLWVLKRRKS
jgi:hypothetical protein